MSSRGWDSDNNTENGHELGDSPKQRVSDKESLNSCRVTSTDANSEKVAETLQHESDNQSSPLSSTDSDSDSDDETITRSAAFHKHSISAKNAPISSTDSDSDDSDSEAPSRSAVFHKQSTKNKRPPSTVTSSTNGSPFVVPSARKLMASPNDRKTTVYTIVKSGCVDDSSVKASSLKRKAYSDDSDGDNNEDSDDDSEKDSDDDFANYKKDVSTSVSRLASSNSQKTKNRKPSAKKAREFSDKDNEVRFHPEMGLCLLEIPGGGTAWMEDLEHPNRLEKKYFSTVHKLKPNVFAYLMSIRGTGEQIKKNKREGSSVLATITCNAFALDISNGDMYPSIEICSHHNGTQVRVNWPVVPMTEEAVIYHANKANEEKKLLREMEDELNKMKMQCLEKDRKLNASKQQLEKTEQELYQKGKQTVELNNLRDQLKAKEEECQRKNECINSLVQLSEQTTAELLSRLDTLGKTVATFQRNFEANFERLTGTYGTQRAQADE